MLLTLLVFSFVINVLASPGTPVPTCDSSQANTVHQCLATYYVQFNITGQLEYWQFLNASATIMGSQGVAGFEGICGWHNAISTCAGPSFSACFTDDNFSGWFNVNRTEATDFRVEYYTTDYECNAGYDIVVQNFKCLGQVQQYDRNEMNSCLNTYLGEVAQGRPFCMTYNQYVTCMDQVYVAFCGPQVKPWICNMEEIGLEVSYQGCNSVLQNCNATNAPKRNL